MIRGAAALVLGAVVLAGCAAPRQGPPLRAIERALSGAPGEAQPSTIVATELAYARAAKEDGQWTASRSFAAPGAVLHGRNGVVPAGPVLAQLSDPSEPIQWAPRTVVMSCDGSLALSLGRFRDPEGLVGNYVTVWERQRDLSYKWVYDVAGPDIPQPPPRKTIEDGNIVVTAIDAVEGLVATCPRGDEQVPAPPTIRSASDRPGEVQISRDRTLRWRWEHRDKGTKIVFADYWYEGDWIRAIEERLVSPPTEAME